MLKQKFLLNIEYRIRLRRKPQKFDGRLQHYFFYFDILSASGGFCGSAVQYKKLSIIYA